MRLFLNTHNPFGWTGPHYLPIFALGVQFRRLRFFLPTLFRGDKKAPLWTPGYHAELYVGGRSYHAPMIGIGTWALSLGSYQLFN